MDREYQPLEEERRTYLLYCYCYYPEGDVPGTSPSSSSPIGFKEIRLLKELFGDHFFDKGKFMQPFCNISEFYTLWIFTHIALNYS